MKQSEKGSAAVEAALILPVLILIMIAIFEYGLYFLRVYIYEQAVFAGARAGAIAEEDKSTAAENEAKSVLEELGITSLPPITVDSAVEGSVPGTTLTTVSIDTAYTPVIGYSSLILPDRISAVSSTLNY